MVNCEKCGASRARLDKYCRHCGAEIPLREPTEAAKLALARVPTSLPATWRPVRPRVWQGMAALVAAALVEALRRELIRRLSTPPTPRSLVPREPPGLVEVIGRQPDTTDPSPSYEVQETILIRRVFRRRG